MTTGMSPPPMASTSVMPMASASRPTSTSSSTPSTELDTAQTASADRPRASRPRATLMAWRAGSRMGTPRIFSESLRKAITLPVKVRPPTMTVSMRLTPVKAPTAGREARVPRAPVSMYWK